ncbi:MAG: sorbosone dehydrogenase [Novosphingobium sp. 28-62-57]|uniref:PQQ-dependent sugar dehydrogenase n=1 Tax=unclassified Novosphingobium TaxID=2644732 RepID=UPI000BDB10D6|nr:MULTISPECIES: sorbosone dehydrogenase family protein [unclassified Novosphingobium]OYW50249.1 MAG: sorbosone dehydrogenase [Novosphingobium sp. 12-62-10]OYZ11646.1 MAG: sorbosone dehydrogenase [Novosphingobium sp. 28-62-57]OZA36987.1 MAG: sorbosone dehydrogenase [Novosphingobium sp. 17-62-9]HQS68821.1 sorbosone dehydrogenase family protein [Novosphingobium sp.]
MNLIKTIAAMLATVIAIAGVWVAWSVRGPEAEFALSETTGPRPKLAEPDEQTVPSIKTAEPVGWKDGELPVAAQGLQVSRFADKLDHPRTMFTMPNGDVLVALTNSPPRDESGITGMVMGFLMKKVGAGGPSPNKIVLLRDADGDGTAEQRFEMSNPALSSPAGMAFRDGRLLVANHDAVLSFPYQPGQTALTGNPEKLMDLPGGGNHWVRNLLLTPDGAKLFVTVGSASNIAEGGIEAEAGRATIHQYDFASKKSIEYAGGLRNPNGLDFNPHSEELWTTVNERDMLGPDLVPDYLTNVPFGSNYGWPWVYWKQNMDWRVKPPMPQYLLDYVRKPEYGLGSHVAPLGLAFAKGGNLMGAKFSQGAFVARHGSWNRRPLAGYDVVFVRFDERGNVLKQPPLPVLTGFLNADQAAHGRPTWVAFAKDGALLVSDDTGGVIWRVVAPGAAPAPAITPLPKRVAPPQGKGSGKFIMKPNAESDLMKPER